MGKYSTSFLRPSMFVKFFVYMLLQCFTMDPELRPSAEQLLAHPWVRKNIGALTVAVDKTEGAAGASGAAARQEDGPMLIRIANTASTSSAQSPLSAPAAAGLLANPFANPQAYPSEDNLGSGIPGTATPSGEQDHRKAVEKAGGNAVKGVEDGTWTGLGFSQQETGNSKAQMGLTMDPSIAATSLPVARANGAGTFADVDAARANAIKTDTAAGADAGSDAAAGADKIDSATTSARADAQAEAERAEAPKATAATKAEPKVASNATAGKSLVTGKVTIAAQAYGAPVDAPADSSAPGGAAESATEVNKTSVVIARGVTLILVAAAAAYFAAYGVRGVVGGA